MGTGRLSEKIKCKRVSVELKCEIKCVKLEGTKVASLKLESFPFNGWATIPISIPITIMIREYDFNLDLP